MNIYLLFFIYYLCFEPFAYRSFGLCVVLSTAYGKLSTPESAFLIHATALFESFFCMLAAIYDVSHDFSPSC